MPAVTIDIAPVPFSVQAQRWADITEQSHPALEMIPFSAQTQRWGDIVEIIPSVEMVPFSTPAQKWGDLVEIPLDPIVDYYDPNSTPFVVTDELVPASGAADVPVYSQIFVPCADRIAVDEDQTVRIVDPFLLAIQPTEGKGLNQPRIKISIRFGAAPPFTVYENGSPQSGWAALVDLNNQAGPNRGIDGVGRSFTLTPSGSLPENTEITVIVYLEDHGRHYSTTEYSFITKAESEVKLSGLFVVAENVLMMQFTGEIVATPSLFNPASFAVENLSGGPDAVVAETLPVYGQTVTVVFLRVEQLIEGTQYRFVINERAVYDRKGRPLEPCFVDYLMHLTKVDMVLNALSNLFGKKLGFTLRTLVEAVMISDEKIGGDF